MFSSSLFQPEGLALPDRPAQPEGRHPGPAETPEAPEVHSIPQPAKSQARRGGGFLGSPVCPKASLCPRGKALATDCLPNLTSSVPRLLACWPAPGLLACYWPAPGLPLACSWPAPGLPLACSWPTGPFACVHTTPPQVSPCLFRRPCPRGSITPCRGALWSTGQVWTD